MQRSSIVSDYLDALTRLLRFDLPLAQRVRQEVEDHLWEAAAAESADLSIEALRHAIRKFGDPRDIASQYAAASLLRQTRRTGTILVLAAAGIFFAMRGRLAWYGMLQVGWSSDLQEIGRIGLQIDRYAYFLAFGIGVAGWAYISSRRASKTFHAAYRDQLTRCLLLCAAAATAMLASVVTDATLTGVRFIEIGFGSSAWVPLISVFVETISIGVLIVQIYRTIQRAAIASTLTGG